jgi:hypothetical protein
MLDRAPGDRFDTTTRPTSRGGEPAAPHRARFVAAAVAAALQVSLALGIGIGFDWRWPLLLVAGLGGWYIGEAAWLGAWDAVTRAQGPESRLHASRVTFGAMAIAFAAWFVGEVIGWFIWMWRLPDSSVGLFDRLAALPFLDWLTPQFGPLELIEILLLTGVAWFAARPR